MYFDCTINYWDEDGEDPRPGKMKNYHRHVLIEAVNYTEAEALATEWGINLTTNNIDVLPIDLLKIDGLYLLNEETRKEKFFFKCDCNYFDETPNGKIKSYKRSILVEAHDSSHAGERAKKIMDDWCFRVDSVVRVVSKTLIETQYKRV